MFKPPSSVRGGVDAAFAGFRQDMRRHRRWLMGGMVGAVITIIIAMFAAMFAKDLP